MENTLQSTIQQIFRRELTIGLSKAKKSGIGRTQAFAMKLSVNELTIPDEPLIIRKGINLVIGF